MPAYEYKALDTSGKLISGVIDADSPKDARARLRAQQIFATEIKETEKSISITSEVKVKKLLKRIGPADVAIVTRQLATLLRAGLPLVRSLQAIEDQLEDNLLRPHIIEIRDDVNKGSSLADALSKHPKVFSPLYINMVHAGESAGALDDILDRLASFSEKSLALRNKVRAAMIYPIFMAIIGVVAVGILLTFVVPTITKVFVDTKQKLPGPTLLLLNISSFMKSFWWLIPIAIVGGVILFKRLRKAKGSRLFMDKFKLRMPIFGQLVRKMAVSRFSRTLSILTASGVPILKALNITRNIIANEVLSQAIDEAIEAVGAGKSIAEPLRKSGAFPPIVSHMITVGETSGKLEEMLQNIAEAYDNEVENSVNALVSLLEPVMIVTMGLVVGLIVFAILLPIFEMNELAM
jgi:general secretion pathway protein F